MSSRTPPAKVIPETPPANILIPPQQTFEHADEERIRTRAHELWDAAGRPDGDGVAYWHQAEREVRGG
ncbi:MAG: DUF2934 domain-containing protein [Gemmataceae bacterium]